ncbi:MAG TPA: glucose 1-dehydrogenase [Bryobacteraceae bacterium]|jgi:NAD(P)-dependent dehydrogenase (short-subunit alcohol dehydrogenase family)|nr:glucose 1-dehydrogenase [Bryobacteraceae bacterium]
MRLKDKVALVTGGASGIGRATAELFAREGARVAVADYSPDGGDTVQAIKSAGGEAIFVPVDVSDSGQVAQMVGTALRAYGRIDILFNGAGILYYGTVLETDEQDWNRVISINLTGTYLCCRAVLPHMIRQGSGSIINVASTVGAHDACANAVAYVTSKGGVTLFTKAIAIDHAKHGVRVNALVPGATDTPMIRKALTPEALEALAASHPIGRLGRPEELAKAVLFLASDDASFVTGTAMFVDGGQTAKI